MPEIRVTSMARNEKLMPLSSDDKTEVLRKLRGRIHFEKILTLSNVNRKFEMALPLWFVKKHGDKIRKSVILRSQSSTKPWTVSLSIAFSPRIQVKVVGGWKAFATSNGLSEGDSLVFSLTAVSEFEVYLFRGMAGNRKQFPSQPPRKRSNECRDERLPAEGNMEGLAKPNGLIAQKKRAVGEDRSASASGHSRSLSSTKNDLHLPDSENIGRDSSSASEKKRAVGEASASDHSQTSCSVSSTSDDLHLPDSENIGRDSSSGGGHFLYNGWPHEPAIDHDKLEVKLEVDTRDGPAQHTSARTKEDCNEYPAFALEKKTVRNESRLPGFIKKLVVSNFYRRRGTEGYESSACFEIPLHFWRTYSSRLHSVVELQGIREESKVRTVACRLHFQRRQTRLYLQAGWKNFADENNLEAGQELLFALTGDSFFVVREV